MEPSLKIDELLNSLVIRREDLSRVISVFNLPENRKCKSLLFLLKIKSILSPYVGLYNLFIQKGFWGTFEKNNLFFSENYCDLLREKLNGDEYMFFEKTKAWFNISFRDFAYIFGHTDDYKNLFGEWTVRVSHKSHYVTVDRIFYEVMCFLENTSIAYKTKHSEYPSDHFISNCIFEFVTEKYFKNSIWRRMDWTSLCSSINDLDTAINEYAESFMAFSSLCASIKNKKSLDVKWQREIDYYQIYGFSELQSQQFLNGGIEIEFQTPDNFNGLKGIGEHLTKNFEKNHLEIDVNYSALTAYDHKSCVIATDESLPLFENFFPVEYSSSIITSYEEYKQVDSVVECLNTLNCEVDSSAGLHIHISKEKADLTALKRIILRYARCEHLIRKYFYSKDRESDHNLYSPSVFSNFYGDASKKDRTKSFLLLVYFLYEAESEIEVYDAASASCRYTGLYTYTKFNTIEFRGHPATLSAERIKNYFDFVQNFIVCSLQNSSPVLDRKYLRFALDARSKDLTSVKKDSLQVHYKYNQYVFNQRTPLEIYRNIYALNVRVSDEIIKTGKLLEPVILRRSISSDRTNNKIRA